MDTEQIRAIEQHRSTMASATDKNSVVPTEACEAPRESHNPALHQGHHSSETQAAATGHYPLAKQSSLLSLTLEDIQTTLCDPGKSFGSMNIDEFLTNILSVDKVGTEGGKPRPAGVLPNAVVANTGPPPASLLRKGCLSVPAPLCRKTVDEVWSDIHREEQQAPQGHMQPQQHQQLGGASHLPTLGEMTLEDFLVKAGVVREGGYLPCSTPLPLNQFPLQSEQLQQHNQCDLPDGYPRAGCGGPAVGVGYRDHPNQPTTTANGVCHGYPNQQKVVLGNDQVGVGSPASPVSSDGLGGGQVASSKPGASGGAGRKRAAAMEARRGRKRILVGGPVEKVVERRQRRMMKNRESAARSRARKQAYTVELEKELNFLKEENARLQEEQRRMMSRRRQMLLESTAEQSGVRRNTKIRRQCCSCVW